MPDDNVKQTIDLSSIDTAPVEVPGGSEGAEKERSMFAHQADQFRKELGWLGKPFGGRREKPGNISALVIIFCFIGMAIVYYHPPGPELGITFERLFGGFTSVVTLVLGYLFGSNEKSDK